VFGVVSEALVLMTERAVSAIDKRTDAEINRQLRLGGIHFHVDHFTLCSIDKRDTGRDAQLTCKNTNNEMSMMQQRKN
jgi:hypothetical protein